MKPKTCKVCREKFAPTKPMQSVCGPLCALSLARSKRAKAEKVAQVKDRRDTKAKLQTLKTKSDWTREAQAAFNGWVRARDAGLPCICCGRTSSGTSTGGDWDAGHYRSRGSAPHLRFDERNVHAQLKQCNRYDSGNVVGYRMGLIARIGLAAVEALEADQASRKFSVEELRAIKAKYTALAKELKA
jgi:hypothetical protein